MWKTSVKWPPSADGLGLGAVKTNYLETCNPKQRPQILNKQALKVMIEHYSLSLLIKSKKFYKTKMFSSEKLPLWSSKKLGIVYP